MAGKSSSCSLWHEAEMDSMLVQWTRISLTLSLLCALFSVNCRSSEADRYHFCLSSTTSTILTLSDFLNYQAFVVFFVRISCSMPYRVHAEDLLIGFLDVLIICVLGVFFGWKLLSTL